MVTLALVAESNADPLKRLKLCLSVLVAVDLLGDGQARVAEDELGVAGRDAKVLTGNRQCSDRGGFISREPAAMGIRQVW
jgi:hypothetical protein